MRTKQLLLALALPLAFTACSNDELIDSTSSPVQKGELVKLGENYSLVGTKGNITETRSIYNGTEFAWLDDSGLNPDKIGLCWRGGEYTNNKSFVYTNYKFTHFAWLGKDETKPVFSCPPVKLSNGKLLTEYTAANDRAALLGGTWESNTSGLFIDAKNGVFNTENSTIFKGDYIVYYPYNDQFMETGYVPAAAPTMIKRDVEGLSATNYTRELANEIFVAGKMDGVDGGQQNGVFSTNFVSGGVVVKITNKTATAIDIHKVVLVDAKGFITKAELDADKIAQGKVGAELYAKEPTEFSKTLVASFYDSNSANAQADLNVAANATQRVAFAALPTTASTTLAGIKVILIDKNEKSYLATTTTTAIKSLAAGEWNTLEVNVTEAFDDVAYAYDTESLIKALTKHNTVTDKGTTINVLNKIALDPKFEYKLPYGSATSAKPLDQIFKNTAASLYIAEDVTLEGTDAIVIPADLQIAFKVVDGKKLTIKTPIQIDDKGCCGTNPGTLVLYSKANDKGNYVFDATVKNAGTLYLGNGATSVNIKLAKLENTGIVNAFSYETPSVADATNIAINELANSNTVNIQAKNWDAATEASVVAATGDNLVTMNVGVLTNSANAKLLVDKRTRLSLTGVSTNAGEIKIESAGSGAAKEDGQLYLASTATLTNTALIENRGVLNNEGKLENNDAVNAVIIDRVGSQFGGNKPKATPGEYICDVDNASKTAGDRLGYALGTNMATTTVRFVDGPAAASYAYNLDSYTLGAKNFIIATTGGNAVTLSSTNSRGDVNSATIGGYLKAENTLNIQKIKLTVAGDITANANVTINAAATNNDATVNASQNVILNEGIFTVNPSASTSSVETIAALAVVGNIEANANYTVSNYARTSVGGNLILAKDKTATFAYSSYTEITGNIAINGIFTRILSSGTATATPAEVWCASYTRGTTAVITNGLPQKR